MHIFHKNRILLLSRDNDDNSVWYFGMLQSDERTNREETMAAAAACWKTEAPGQRSTGLSERPRACMLGNIPWIHTTGMVEVRMRL